jgi:RNA polymerase sigma-70 factor (ECF subfamily)
LPVWPSVVEMVDPGDERASVQALEELYRRRYGRFLRVAIAVVGSRDAAADAVQDAFARALRARHELRSSDALEAWVWRMVVNAAVDQHRARRETTLAEEEPASRDSGEWPELRTAVASLPERQRHALFLRHYADLSYEDIAAVLGVARGTVAATLHAAHESLRERLPEVAR